MWDGIKQIKSIKIPQAAIFRVGKYPTPTPNKISNTPDIKLINSGLGKNGGISGR